MSSIGRRRVNALTQTRWLSGTTRLIATGEPKALETAEIIAAALGLVVEVRGAMHKNDRSATGFLPPCEFEVVANEFFAAPTVSDPGWEPAFAAQARIVRKVEAGQPLAGNLLIVGHGAVGTLLFCHYSRILISRAHDQPADGGNYFTFLRNGRHVLHA